MHNCSLFVRIRILQAIVICALCCSCAKGPFVPVNEGREYGNPKTPWVVSHIPEANRWALSRTGHHHFFGKILCFNYPCRKMIGRRKVLRAISFEALRKKVRKNAKKGAYKKYTIPPPRTKTDTVIIPVDTTTIANNEPLPKIAPPILKADSLITLNEFLFETDSYKLKAEQLAELDSIAGFILTHPTLEITVSGHTDNTGTERHNVSLSTRRAEVVAEYLIDKGALYDQVSFQGFGSSRPIAGNDKEEGRRKNRRVEILIRNPTKK